MQIKATKVAAVVAGLAMATSMLSFVSVAHAASLTSSQVSSILSLLSSFGASSATIANVQAALNGTSSTSTVGGTTTTTATSCSVGTTDLTIGSTGMAVTCLQQALIGGGYSIPALTSGGSAYGYFGAQTQAAVSAWQKAVGVSPTAGYFGAISRAHWNLGGGSTSTSSTTTTTTTTTQPTAGTGNGLKIMLSATSPNGTVLVQGQGIGDLGDFVFANPTATPINVTALSFMRTGVSNDATLNNVYLYNGMTRITDSAGVNNSAFSFSNSAGLFTVPAGMTYTVSVRSDILNGTSGQQIGVELVSASSSGTLDSSVSLPIMSGYQTISAANLATVSFNATTLPTGSGITISPQSSYTVWQNTVSVSTNPVKLSEMTFTNLGSISATDIGNFRLYVDGTQVGNAVPALTSGRTVVFDLSANPVLLSTQSHVIKVLADIIGGASNTFELSLQRSSDAMFIDSQLNQPVTPVSNGSSTNFSAVSAAQVTVQSVSGSTGISVSRDPASATNSVSVGATSVNFATFDMLASGEPVKVQDLYVCANTETAGYTGAGGGLANGKIYLNGVQVGSTKAIQECSPEGTGSTGGGTDFSLGSSLILPAGQTALVAVYADANTGFATSSISANTNIPTNNAVQIQLNAGSSNAQGQDSLSSANVPSSYVQGNKVTLSSSALTASKYSGYANQSITPGSQNALIGEFTLAAGSTEGVNVNTIGIDASTTWAGYLQNLTLRNMATNAQIGTVISTPSGGTPGTNSFSLGSNLAIPESGSVTVGVYANILSTATGIGQQTLAVDAAGTSGTGATTGTTANLAQGVVLQGITPQSGSLTVSLGASNPVAANVIAGSSSLEVGDFQFSANNSSYTIQKLQIDVPTASAAALTSVSLHDGSGNVLGTLTGASSVTSATSSYAFTGLSDLITSGNQSDVSVWVGVTTIASGGSSISGKSIVVALNHSVGFQAQDQSGTLATTFTSDVNSNANSGYGTLVVRKSIPTFTMLVNPNTNPAAGTSIYQFKISADPSNPVDVDQVSFNVSTSTSILTNWNLYDITSGSAISVGGTNVNVAGSVLTFNFGAVPQQIGAGQSRTYELIPGTLSAWAQGDSVSVSLAQDTTLLSANGYSTDLTGGKVIWSDRSATGHAAGNSSVGTNDWTNGYLLKDFVNDVTSYTHS